MWLDTAALKLRFTFQRQNIVSMYRYILHTRWIILQIRRTSQGKAYGHLRLSHKLPSGFITWGWQEWAIVEEQISCGWLHYFTAGTLSHTSDHIHAQVASYCFEEMQRSIDRYWEGVRRQNCIFCCCGVTKCHTRHWL